MDRHLDHGKVRFRLIVKFVLSISHTERCDAVDIRTGEVKPLKKSRPTYATAQKMRAAMTHKFGRDYRLGTQQWTENATVPGLFQGNPSVLVTVSQYMVSLRRNKVCRDISVSSTRS